MRITGNCRTETGRHAEQLAERYLGGKGLRLLARNYRCRGGEIDLIMSDGDSLVFVEVRYRKHQHFGGAAASVDRRKQQRLILAAQYYLQQTRSSSLPCRFDVVAISPGGHDGPRIEWLTNAFELD
ncbi:MAG TPA: YraN family protein [Gammaproteobacteria bacterium]